MTPFFFRLMAVLSAVALLGSCATTPPPGSPPTTTQKVVMEMKCNWQGVALGGAAGLAVGLMNNSSGLATAAWTVGGMGVGYLVQSGIRNVPCARDMDGAVYAPVSADLQPHVDMRDAKVVPGQADPWVRLRETPDGKTYLPVKPVGRVEERPLPAVQTRQATAHRLRLGRNTCYVVMTDRHGAMLTATRKLKNGCDGLQTAVTTDLPALACVKVLTDGRGTVWKRMVVPMAACAA